MNIHVARFGEVKESTLEFGKQGTNIKRHPAPAIQTDESNGTCCLLYKLTNVVRPLLDHRFHEQLVF